MQLRRFWILWIAGLLVAVALVPASLGAAPAPQGSPTCQFFTETGGGQGGYSVCDDTQGRFLTEFRRLGGARLLGYPVSRRFERDGFIQQAFQKAILQWRSDQNRVNLVNVFDELHDRGYDQRLLEVRQTPNQLPAGWDGGAVFDQVVRQRQALLEQRPSLRSAYFAAGDPLTFFGLPTSQVTDMGNHYAIRLQRAVLQEWKENVPWARIGEVTIANGGDIAKELGYLPAAALSPEPSASGSPPPVVSGGQQPPPPPPTAAPAPTTPPVAASTQFRVTESYMAHRTINGCGLNILFLKVLDAAGNPLNGVPIDVIWPGGSFTLVTGEKGPGQAEFTMRGAYQARIAAPFTSETTRWLDNEFPKPDDLISAGYCSSVEECKDLESKNQLCRWHYSWHATFQRTN